MKMTTIKRILAGASAFALLFSSSINSGLSAIAETTSFDESTFSVNVPEQWTNTCDNWIETSDDIKVYYKVSDHDKPDSAWGAYTDADAREWNQGVDLNETNADGDYIKFWAVKETSVFDETEILHFYYDKTKPDFFDMYKDEAKTPYTLQSSSSVTDSLSGIRCIYYSITQEYNTTDEIETNCNVANYSTDGNGVRVSINCTSDMPGNIVYVYAIDNAGNIQTSYINVDSYMDTSAPSLIVNGIDSNKWVNKETRLNTWNVYTDSDDAKVYYKVSDTDLEDAWGDYSEAFEWSDDAAIPEGEKYIHFWAAYDSSERDVSEETRFYKYDSSDPEPFSVVSEHTDGHYDEENHKYIQPQFIIKGSGIYDSISGINKTLIKYNIKNANNEEEEKGTVSIADQTVNPDGSISFVLDLSNEDWLNNVDIIFYVSDMAENTTSSQLDNIHYDPHAPQIVKGENNIGITNGTDSNSPIMMPISFGGEKTGTLYNSVYVNNNDHYIKVVIDDNNLKNIIINVDGAENGVKFSKDGGETQGRKWICEDNQNSDTKTYFIKISDLKLDPDTNHSIKISASDGYNTSEAVSLSIGDDDNETEYTLFYDPKEDNEENEPEITFIANEEIESVDNYYGLGVDKNSISIVVSDDNGLSDYSVKINDTYVVSTDLSSGEMTTGMYTTVVTKTDVDRTIQSSTNIATETYPVPIKRTSYTLTLNDEVYPFIKDGKLIDGNYEIFVSARDLAGNEHSESYSFIIDTTAPQIERCEYQYNKSLIKYLSFGLFGNESYKISIAAHDPDVESDVPGIGIKSVVLEWDSNTYEGKYNAETNMYDFEAFSVGHKDVPVIIITDKLGNTANYCMASSDDRDDNNDGKAEIKLNEGKGQIPLVLENALPVSTIVPPEKFAISAGETDALTIYKHTFEDNHVEWWYPSEIEYQVTAQDVDSGLYSVLVLENNEQRAEEKKFGNSAFDSKSFVDLATYSYAISEEGNYNLFTYATDNAQNSNQTNPKPSQSLIIHLDKTKPQITEFQFAGNLDQGDTVERTTYGFFFKEDTEVRVYVDDLGVSSGLNNVVLYLSNVNGDNKSFTKAVSAFDTDQQDGRKYASFTIEKGFKGKVTAIVTDNVGHSSGLINANGNIIEDPDLHTRTSSIEIKENEAAKQNDANDVPLYNTSIPITVTVEDSFSGISRIDWSIADDNESGTIEVDINGDWRNASGEAQILEDSIERDQNLITKIQFVIVVDSNTNGNAVHVTLTDRSGNTSEYDTSYSIDTTVPVISASLGGGSAANGYYYNTNQTITISIAERNFDPSAVVVKVNDSPQAVQWNEQGASVTTDETVHIGTFSITADGEYDFTISYADMAGNFGTPYSQSRFVIDKTSPKISNNFESFGSVDDENIYYNISQKNSAKAEITVIETNFSPADMNVVVYYQSAGSKHSDTEANWNTYYYSSDWKDNGDGKHTLIIPFTEDGVYKVVMSPVDLAGNAGDFSKGENGQYPSKTAIFETDYTAPVIVSRNDKPVESDDVQFYDLYDFERRNDVAPTVVFEDTNIDHIACDGQKYTPVYTNGREIGEIKPEDIGGESNELVLDSYVPQMIYTLDSFTADGVYSAKLTAYDKAGNKSEVNDNTYVRMTDPTVNVLAYIENSNRERLEGWYSFEDENGPISKQPSSFSDLSIVVLSKTSNTRICLVDKATNSSTDTNITDDKDALFDNGMYQVSAYRYTLPGEYFEKNYTADADTNLYLRVENNGEILDLGEMYIDNTDPDCTIPEHFHDWGWFKGSGNQTITFENISEVLDINETVAYVDGQTIKLSNIDGNESSIFSYDEKNDTLALILEPGSHKVGLLLVDRAGNSKTISEVQHLAVGNYRIWIGVGSGLAVILLTTIAVFVVKRVKRRRLV